MSFELDRRKFLRFAAGGAAAFDRCLTARITDALGVGIAGRPLFMRFGVQGRAGCA